MKTLKSGWLFAGGALFGLSLALCMGAVTRTNTAPNVPATAAQSPPVAPAPAPKAEWAHLKVVVYPNGGTGFFDEVTGTMYVYDNQLRSCYLIRQLRTLGDPMQ